MNKHIYLGGNTRKGFVSFYERLQKNDNCRVFILKGGPGTGKSTFIKKTIALLKDLNCDMDILHCSGDPSSLDGVISVSAGVIVVDGTSPHQLDPALPGARENILNLGEFWDASLLEKYKSDIAACNKEKKLMYQKAYHYLAAAGAVYDDSNYILSNCIEEGKMFLFAENLAGEILTAREPAVARGSDVKAFATAITAGGILGSPNKLFDEDVTAVYCLRSIFGLSTAPILEIIKNIMLNHGLNTESFYCGFNADALEHLYIPEIKTAILTSNEFHESCGSDQYFEYPMEGFLKGSVFCADRDDLKYNRIRFEELTDRAVRALNKARLAHGATEEYYVAAMDFNAINQYTENILSEIGDLAHRNIML